MLCCAVLGSMANALLPCEGNAAIPVISVLMSSMLCCATAGRTAIPVNHAMVLVGFNVKDPANPYWIVK